MCTAGPGPHNGRGLFSSEAGLPSGSWRPDSQQPRHCLAEPGPRVSCGHAQISCQGWARFTRCRLPISPFPRASPASWSPRLNALGMLPLQPRRKPSQEGSPQAPLYLSCSWGGPGEPSWPATIHVFLPVAARGSLEGGFLRLRLWAGPAGS